jgi:beta-galactosidase beta subunit
MKKKLIVIILIASLSCKEEKKYNPEFEYKKHLLILERIGRRIPVSIDIYNKHIRDLEVIAGKVDNNKPLYTKIVKSLDSLKEIEYHLSEEGTVQSKLHNIYYSQEDIDKQFSPYDGSHRRLEEYVQERMKDPDSYEHVKSEYKAHEDYLEVLLTYRGKNSYNATTTEQVRAKCDLNTGEVLEIIN